MLSRFGVLASRLVTSFLGAGSETPAERYAPLAQSAEQLTLNQWVLGSSPRGCTTWIPGFPEHFGGPGIFSFHGVGGHDSATPPTSPSALVASATGGQRRGTLCTNPSPSAGAASQD